MINLFFISHEFSGAAKYAQELLKYLSMNSDISIYKVHLYNSEYNEYTVTKKDRITNVYVPQIHCLNSKDNLKYATRSIDLMDPLLKRKSNTIFHINCSTQIIFGIEARNRFGVKLVYSVHFLPSYFSFFELDSIPLETLATENDELDKIASTEVDHVICVTNFAKRIQNQYYGIPNDRISVIFNGLSNSNRDESEIEFRKKQRRKFGIGSNEIVMLFVGRLTEDKGIRPLAKAFTQLAKEYDNIRLVFVGEGNYDKIFNLINEKRACILMTGRLHPQEVQKFYRIADIGVIPSSFEQCSYVALEMMMHKLAIVCSEAPGLKELFSNKVNSVTVPLIKSINGHHRLQVSFDDLYSALKMTLNDNLLREKIGAIAYDDWSNKYTSRHMGLSTMAIYKKLINTS